MMSPLPVSTQEARMRATLRTVVVLVSSIGLFPAGAQAQASSDKPVGFELEWLPEPPPVFGLIERAGGVSRAEMRAVFNMGLGLCVTVAEPEADKAVETLRGTGLAAWRIGHAVADPERRVRVRSERIVGLSKHFAAEP